MVTDADLAALTADPLPWLEHDDPAVRRLAISALSSRPAAPQTAAELGRMLAGDPEPRVRAAAAEALGMHGPAATAPLLRATADADPLVAEAVATALGEVGAAAAVPWLIRLATDRGDRLAAEAAVASLGAIGDERAVDTLVELAASGPPQIRRRSIVALTAFDGPQAEAAVRAGLEDRNPMVREVAQMIVGRPVTGQGPDGDVDGGAGV